MAFEFKMPAGESLQYKDWEFPSVPIPSSTRPSFVDSVNVAPPLPQSRTNKPFPEFAIIDPSTILSGIHSLSTAFDKGLGVAKNVIPGLAGAGDALGSAGRAIEQSPVGAPLGVAGSAITGGVGGIVQETMGALARRAGQVGEEIGRTFDSPWNVLNAPFRIGATAALGDTGSKLMRGGLDFSTAGRDILDSINLVGILPAFKGAGMLIKGAANLGAAGQFGTGVARAAFPSMGATTAEKAGIVAGRATLALSGVGLAADFALPKLAPNEPWAQNILNNRVVAEDSPWRFPFEAATTLPMDLFAMTKLAKESKLASWAHEKTFGPPRLLSEYLISDEATTNALKGGLITKQELRLVNDYGIRQYAEELIVQNYNESRFFRKGDDGFAISSKDLPMTQGEFNAEVKAWVDKLYDTMGADRLHREAADRVRSIFGWEDMSEAQILREFPWYARRAMEIEPLLPGRVVGVNTINAFWQAPRALERLDGMKTLSKAEYDQLLHDYPALKTVDGFEKAGTDLTKIKLVLNDYRKFLRADKDAAEIASIRAQIKSIEKNMDDIEITFGKEKVEHIFDPKSKTTTTRKPWYEAHAELVALEQRYAVLNAPSYFKLGIMERELADMAEQIVKNPTDALRYRYGYLQSQVKQIREAAAEEHLKTIRTKQGLIAAREEEIRWARGSFDEDIVDAELEVLNEGLENATEAYYNAVMAGSRWHIERAPSGPLMRLRDKLPDEYKLDPNPGLRTPIGKLFDTMFGALPNKKLGKEAWDYMRAKYAEGGSTEEGMNKLFQAAFDELNVWGYTVPGGYRSNAFVSIFHLPPQWWNQTAQRINQEASVAAKKTVSIVSAPKGMSVSEVVFRAYPGPLKIFAKQALGRELPDIPYSPIYHAVTRSFYPMLRFFLSPRFLALNMFEAKFIGAGRGGPSFFAGEPNPWFERLAKDMEEFGQRTEHGFLEPMPMGHARDKMIQNVAKLAWTKRADEVVHAILDTIRRRPEMEGVMRDLGRDAIKFDYPKIPLVEDIALKAGKPAHKLTEKDFIAHRPKPARGSPAPDFDDMARSIEIDPSRAGITEEGHRIIKGGGELTDIRNFVYRAEDGTPQGVLVIFLDKGTKKANLLEVSVAPTFRRKGVASGLYEAAEKAGYRVDDAMPDRALTEEGAALQFARWQKKISEVETRAIHSRPIVTRDKWYGEINKMFQLREKIRDARYATTQELKELSEVVTKKTDELTKVKGTGDELRARAELREATEKYEDVAAREALQKDAEAIYGADIKKYQPFMDAIVHQFREVIRAERMAFMGNPNRSAMERLLNSFLLYWPFSYQFKASKLLADFMFSRGFGFHTGSSVAAAWGEIRRQHDDKMKNDPEYAAFFKKNKDLLTFMRQFIPVTPEDVGVSLSPFLRVPYHVAKGDAKRGPITQLSRLYTVGPLHDTTLVTEIAREQSKRGGLLHDIFEDEETGE